MSVILLSCIVKCDTIYCKVHLYSRKKVKIIIQSRIDNRNLDNPGTFFSVCLSWTEFLIPAIKILESLKMSFSYFIFQFNPMRIFFPEICLWL